MHCCALPYLACITVDLNLADWAASVAQLAEHWTSNPVVTGLNPVRGSSVFFSLSAFRLCLTSLVLICIYMYEIDHVHVLYTCMCTIAELNNVHVHVYIQCTCTSTCTCSCMCRSVCSLHLTLFNCHTHTLAG